jgi:oxygen-independent coproporphyrinogen-3 oxidase
MTATSFDPALVSRYDVNGPRYTSYPTANLFAAGFPAAVYQRALAGLARQAHPALSLYVHVPFCATVCYYCACNRIITNNRRHAVAYLERLQREMALVSALLPADHRVEQLHFHLVDGDERDFSIEIDPRTVSPARIRTLAGLGVDRVSLGVQDFDPAVQAAVNRIQSVADTRAIIDAARAAGMRSVSVDLIYGLPRQTAASFARTLDTVCDIGPDRISLYSYAHLPERFKTQRQIDVTDLPRPEVKLELLELAIEKLGAAGYRYVGMDHFAREDDGLVRAQQRGALHRNFQGYTTHRHCDLIGLGVSAISDVGGVYAQNAKDLADYAKLVDAGQLAVERGLECSREDRLRRDLIVELMCHFRLDMAAFGARHGIDFRSHFAAELKRLAPLAADGLVQLGPELLTVTPRGRYLIRNVCMQFDAYLTPSPTGFSRAI